MVVVNDQDHPQMIDICAKLQRLPHQQPCLMRGYVLYTKFVLRDVEEEENVFHLHHRNEKIAIALGLINIAPGTPLRIRKNLWFCEDFHTSVTFISKIVGRAIMVRMPIALITLKMVFVLAGTTGDIQ